MFQKLLVEFLGTVFFLYVIIAVGNPLAIGLALAIAIMIGGKISGGYFNPAVSIMMYMKGDLKGEDLPGYIIAQILGGLAALSFHKMIK